MYFFRQIVWSEVGLVHNCSDVLGLRSMEGGPLFHSKIYHMLLLRDYGNYLYHG